MPTRTSTHPRFVKAYERADKFKQLRTQLGLNDAAPTPCTKEEYEEHAQAVEWCEISPREAAPLYPELFGDHELALCLSGGGYRAALYHLGALRRLNELGLLSRVNTISSVSGGSIIAAFLEACVEAWPEPGGVIPDWEQKIAEPFRAFTAIDIRTRATLRELNPVNWITKSFGAASLTKTYLAKNNDKKMVELRPHPHFVFCSAEMGFASPFYLTRSLIGATEPGYVKTPASLTVAQAVAASSCFPPIFRPMDLDVHEGDQVRIYRGFPTDLHPYSIRGKRRLKLTDGGNFDNLGVYPTIDRHKCLLVSNAEHREYALWDGKRIMSRAMRHQAIAGRATTSLRARWLKKALVGGMWEFDENSSLPLTPSTDRKHYDDPIRYNIFMGSRIASLRTDMNAFTESEIKVIENHGYCECNAVLEVLAKSDDPKIAVVKAWILAALSTVVPLPPHPDYMRHNMASAAIYKSHNKFYQFKRHHLYVDDFEP